MVDYVIICGHKANNSEKVFILFSAALFIVEE